MATADKVRKLGKGLSQRKFDEMWILIISPSEII